MIWAAVKPYLNYGPGHAVLMLHEQCAHLSSISCKIIRQGVAASNLSPLGWQIEEFIWTLPVIEVSASSAILLPPDVVAYMMASTNYIFRLLNFHDDQVDIVVSWRGIPGFRKEDILINSAIDESQIKQKNTQYNYTIQEIKKANELSDSHLHHKNDIEEKSSSISSVKEDNPDRDKTINNIKVQDNPRIERRKINCPNPDCDQIIFSTFKNCPFCKIALHR